MFSGTFSGLKYSRLLRQSLPPTFAPVVQKTLVVLGIWSMLWLGGEYLYQKRVAKAFNAAQSSMRLDLKGRLDEEAHVREIIASFETDLSSTMERQLAYLILDLADHYKMDPYLILGVIRVESYFYNRAVSVSGAEGLMQVLPVVGEEVAGELGIPYSYGTSLFNPLINVQIGTHYLAHLLSIFNGDVELALIAYNRGPNGLKKALNQGTGVGTEYADNVLLQYQRYLKDRHQTVAGNTI